MTVTCPTCARALRLKPEVVGRRVRCPGCDTAFVAAADGAAEAAAPRPSRSRPASHDEDDAPLPRRRADRDDYDDDRPRPTRRRRARRNGPPVLMWVLIGGGVLAALLIAGVVTVAAIGASRGSTVSKHEALATEAVALSRRLIEILESVKDPDSARAAAVQINELCDRMEELGRRQKALPRLTVQEDAKIKQRVDPEINALNARAHAAGFQAGMNSRGEASFIAAVKRLETVGKSPR